jgi:ferritin-like metal-binding protein YciE
MRVASFHKLLLTELGDMLDFEQQIIKALPLMVKKASDKQLRAGFKEHLKQTRGQVKRLKKVFQLLGAKPKKVRCSGMKGILEEGKETMKATMPAAVMDAALISKAQSVEHYEMAAYGTARTYAEMMGHTEAARLLQETLDEEAATNEKLTRLAEEQVNPEALAAYPGMKRGRGV